jgi:hypothetical protein
LQSGLQNLQPGLQSTSLRIRQNPGGNHGPRETVRTGEQAEASVERASA